MGRVTKTVDEEGYALETYYDSRGLPIYEETTGADVLTTDWHYVSNRIVSSGGQLLRQVDHVYDGAGRLDHEVGPHDPNVADGVLPNRAYSWTAAGRLDTLDANGSMTDFIYNADGMLEREDYLGLPSSGTTPTAFSRGSRARSGSASSLRTTMEARSIICSTT